jgi:GGDEF domain-containing protein
MSLRTSIGVKTFDFTGEKRLSNPATKLLAEVDEVLYIAKREGKNRISY